MGELTDRRDAPVELDKVEIARDLQAYMLPVLGSEEMVKRNGLPTDLIDVLCDTELPQEEFPIVEIGSVKNDTTRAKYEILNNTPGLLEAGMIPGFMTKEYPISFDEPEVLEKAPWVNMVHAWMKVLNWSNTLIAIQRGKIVEKDIAKSLAPMVESLYKFTTESDGDFFSRTSQQFKNQEKFAETLNRESGTKGVNLTRHVSLGEMKYILQTMRRAFAKQSF